MRDIPADSNNLCMRLTTASSAFQFHHVKVALATQCIFSSEQHCAACVIGDLCGAAFHYVITLRCVMLRWVRYVNETTRGPLRS